MCKNKFLLIIILICQSILAQEDSVRKLEDVVIPDTQLKTFSTTNKLQVLNDSIIEKNSNSLTTLLQYNSTIYFKENGLGMVSSPSFRGTTAQQTAVVWNGININSVLTGQTDFNTISTESYNNIAIRAGGGSTIYGTGAIGGSIHLNSEINFAKQIKNKILVNYGSFNTQNINYQLIVSNKKVSTQIIFSHTQSDNDYKYPNTNLKNENGAYHNTNFGVNFGYKINENNFLKFYSETYDNERHFSGTLAAPSKSKYKILNSRNLAEWSLDFAKFTSKVKIAQLAEMYAYFEDANIATFSSGKAETLVAKEELLYTPTDKITFNSVLEFSNTKGTGSSLLDGERQLFSGLLLTKYFINSSFEFLGSIKKEVTSNYPSPLLYSIGLNINPTKRYNIKINHSKNFRIPTFNDLYWQYGGNPNLKPESSSQYEINQEINFRKIHFTATVFYNDISNLIAWQPNEYGFWQPKNILKVATYGLESTFAIHKNFQKHHFYWNINYAYTKSEDIATKKQSIYVPLHKATNLLSYNYNKIEFVAQHLFNSEVYTSTDNFYKLKGYNIVNFSGFYNFGKINTYKLGFSVLNAFNKSYQNVSMRPMPGTNYSINLIFKF